MRRTFLIALALVLSLSAAAQASSFMSLSNGATTLSCNNSTAAGVTACSAQGFTTSLASNTITFAGTVGGYGVARVALQGNQPGTVTQGFALGTNAGVTNVSAGSSSLTIAIASNDFVLPSGSPLGLSASQSGTFTTSLKGDKESFTGFGNAANTLAIAGVANPTPDCINPSTAPPVSACNTTSVPTTFSRSASYALAGSETITLAQGDVANFTTTVSANGVAAPTGCAATKGFWKNANKHPFPSSLPFPVTIAGVSYSVNDFYTILGSPAGGNAVLIMGSQLVASLLNIAAGAAFSQPVANAISGAETLLTVGLPGDNPPGLTFPIDMTTGVVDSSTDLGTAMTNVGTFLDGFNSANFGTCSEGSGLTLGN